MIGFKDLHLTILWDIQNTDLVLKNRYNKIIIDAIHEGINNYS